MHSFLRQLFRLTAVAVAIAVGIGPQGAHAQTIFASDDSAISMASPIYQIFYAVDAATQCMTTGTYSEDTTNGVITLSMTAASYSAACTGVTTAITFPTSCVVTPTSMTCRSKQLFTAVNASWQLPTAVYQSCSSSAEQLRVNNTAMTLDLFANGCVFSRLPYVARGGQVWLMGLPISVYACQAQQPPATASPPSPQSTPAPPTRNGAFITATTGALCSATSASSCFYTNCAGAGGGGAASGDSPSSSSTTIVIAVGVVIAVLAVAGIVVGLVLVRRRPAAGQAAAADLATVMTSAQLQGRQHRRDPSTVYKAEKHADLL